ncbi:MAG: diguanylate cyclase [Calditrichaeota bacterium]|nr:MAG: diguanylate cyclase [Calditrichota bacterium]
MEYKALIVDDDRTLLRLLDVYLAKNDIEVVAMTNARDALRYLETELPDIIVSDIMMPEMDGLAFRKAIMSDDRLKLIPFIFLTAKGELEERLTGYQLYVDDYISKPFEPREALTRMNAALKRHSIYHDLLRYDSLTMTTNRKTSEEILTREFERAKRYGSPLTIALLDIDHFKICNDTYGHVFGDLVLIKVSDTLMSQVRNTDVVGRYGGEEFLVIMPETKLQDAVTVVERMRFYVEQLTFDPQGFTVTISAGVCQCQAGFENIRQFIHQADTALYKAKNNGRNRVEIAA